MTFAINQVADIVDPPTMQIRQFSNKDDIIDVRKNDIMPCANKNFGKCNLPLIDNKFNQK